MSKHVQLYTDGGARGNPGPAGIGYVIWDGHQLVDKGSKYIGETTNNQAEYQAIILGLENAKKIGVEEVDCFLDPVFVSPFESSFVGFPFSLLLFPLKDDFL